jgi:hypothetical protein
MRANKKRVLVTGHSYGTLHTDNKPAVKFVCSLYPFPTLCRLVFVGVLAPEPQDNTQMLFVKGHWQK